MQTMHSNHKHLCIRQQKDYNRMNKENFNPDSEFKEDSNTENMTDECVDNVQNDTDNADLTEEAKEKIEDSLEERYNELNSSYLRLHAEFDNFRKRTIKEKADLIKTGGERIFVDMLPVVDDFERALESIKTAEDVEAVKNGVDLIYNKFIAFLTRQGVKEIDTIGQSFDSEKHEAITTIPTQNDADRDKIVDCIEKGYTLDDKVIRFPKVIVAK